MLTSLIGGIVGIVIHESAHVAASVAQGLPFLGVKIKRNTTIAVVCGAGTPRQNAITAAAGPVASLLLGCLTWHASHDFAFINFIFAAMNVLPFKGSDGARIWMAVRQ